MKQILLSIILFSLLLMACEKMEPITKIETIDVKVTSASTVTANGQIVELSAQDHNEYGFVYSTNNEPTVDDTNLKLSNPKEGVFSENISDLQPNTKYYLRAYCNDGSSYIYGKTHAFKTESAEVSFNKSDVLAMAPDFAIINCEVVFDNNIAVTERGICWSKEANPSLNNNYIASGDGLGTYVIEIKNLDANTDYYFKPYAINISGVFYGDEITLKTLEQGTLIDFDGNRYTTITIGNQTWMAENLRTKHYRNGVAIENIQDDNLWENDLIGAFSIFPIELIGFDNNAEMEAAYGILYNWYSVVNLNNICPYGWRVPTDDDWNELVSFIGGNADEAGNKIKSCKQVLSPMSGDCSTTEHPRWDSDNTYYGTDDYGFGGLPSGLRYSNGTCINIGSQACWWSSTALGTNNAWYRSVYSNSGTISRSADLKTLGLSVRCIKEN